MARSRLPYSDETPALRDRRSLGTAQKPSGVLVGHTEGITYVSSKGDGRYVISNGKDQALRLWDLRRMRSSEEFDEIGHNEYHIRGYDYRYVPSVFLAKRTLKRIYKQTRGVPNAQGVSTPEGL